MEILGLTPTEWSSLAVAISTAVIGGAMLILGRERLHFIWAAFCIAVCVYAGGFYMVVHANNPEAAQFWWRIEYIGTILIPFIFFHFVLEFIGRSRAHLVVPLYLIGATFVYFDLTTNLVIDRVTFMFGELYYNSPPGILHPYLMLLYIVLIGGAHYLVFKAYRSSTDPDFLARTRYFFLATSIGFIGGTMNFLAVYGIPIHPTTQLSIIVAPPLIGFAILRYRLFNIRVVTAQFLTLILSTFALFRLIVSKSFQEGILNSLLLGVTLIVGIYLIRSVKREVEQREEIERLSEEKSEFMTFASHEIRNPITAMRGYASLILDGTDGAVNKHVKDAAQKILVEGNEVLNLISEFLNKSKTELGQISYEKARFDLGAAIASIANGYAPHAEQKGLRLVTHIPDHSVTISADEGKVKEVVGNLIDNSLKYTKEGSITVSVERHGVAVRVVVSDTGVGIPPEVLPQLFKKFSRADAQKANLLGTGVGLYLAKVFIEAMGGRIWAESPVVEHSSLRGTAEEQGKGSRFIVEFSAT